MLNILGNLIEELIVISLTGILVIGIAALRVAGVTHTAYQAVAHCLVAGLIVVGWNYCRKYDINWPLKKTVVH